MDLGLTGKRALVMASSRGLGFGVARILAREGASIAVCGRSRERLAAAVAASDIPKSATVVLIEADLAKLDGTERLIAAAEREMGGVDILVNNTGGPPAAAVSTVVIEEWRRQFEALVMSVFQATHHFLPGMRSRRWGRILTIASSGVVQPIPNLGISNALRSSVVGWSKTLSAEVAADGVTVNVILPGRIHTERVNEIDAVMAERNGTSRDEVMRESHAAIPMRRYGTIEEFAAAAAFLVSVPAAYVTGTMLRVDGGYIRSV